MKYDYKTIVLTSVAGFSSSNYAQYIAKKHLFNNIEFIDELCDEV